MEHPRLVVKPSVRCRDKPDKSLQTKTCGRMTGTRPSKEKKENCHKKVPSDTRMTAGDPRRVDAIPQEEAVCSWVVLED